MQLLMAEEEEVRREEGGRQRRRSTLLHPSSPTKFDYSAYHDPNTFTFTDFTNRDVSKLGMGEWRNALWINGRMNE